MFLLHSRKVPFNSTFFFLNLSSQQIYAQFSERLKAKGNAKDSKFFIKPYQTIILINLSNLFNTFIVCKICRIPYSL